MDWKPSAAQISPLGSRTYNCPGYLFFYLYGPLTHHTFQIRPSSNSPNFWKKHPNQPPNYFSNLTLFFPQASGPFSQIRLWNEFHWSSGVKDLWKWAQRERGLEHERKCRKFCLAGALLVLEGQQWERTPGMQLGTVHVGGALSALTGVSIWESKYACVLSPLPALWSTEKITKGTGGPHRGRLSIWPSQLPHWPLCQGACSSWDEEDPPRLTGPASSCEPLSPPSPVRFFQGLCLCRTTSAKSFFF